MRVRDLIAGTMKSTKSAQLIMKGYSLDLQGKNVLTFKPEADTRDGAFVTSRALPIKRPAIVVPTLDSGMIMSNLVWMNKPDVILIDEMQFFTIEQIDKIAEISILYDVDIYAYGLMISYNGKMFDSIKRTIESGFRLNILEMSCDHCNNDATHHLLYYDGKLIKDGNEIAVEDDKFNEDNQSYESVCFYCYQKALDIAEMNDIENAGLEDKYLLH